MYGFWGAFDLLVWRLAMGGAGRDRIQVGAKFFAHFQTGCGAHPASCTMGTGSLQGGKRPAMVLTTHPPR
jgi:hypothetical protein